MTENKVQKDIDIDLKLLENFLCGEGSDVIEENDLTNFDNACRIFAYTNEYLRLYYDRELNDKKVLSVTSGGDHILHAALAGAPNITGFDINRLCKYYVALKIAMIKKYNLEDFLDKIDIVMLMDYHSLYFSSFERKGFIKNMNNIISEVHKYLNEDVILFWEKVIDIVKQKEQVEDLFVNYSHNDFECNNAWTDKENFSKLKYNLSSCEIKFIDSNVNTVREKTSEKFDVIYLSNIIGRIYDEEKPKTIELLSYLRKTLNNNGVIYDYDWHDASFKSKNKVITRQYKVDWLEIEADGAYVYKFTKKKRLFKM